MIGTTILSGLLGILVMIPVHAKRLEHWRNQQSKLALQDLQLLDKLSNNLPETESKELEPLIARGELRWEREQTSLSDLTPYWFREPNGFERMRMSHTWQSKDGAQTTATLVRRFTREEIENLLGDGTVAMLLAGIASAIASSIFVYFQKARTLELRWLRSLGDSLHKKDLRDTPAPKLVASQSFVEGVYSIADTMNREVESIRASYRNSARAMANMPIGILSFDSNLVLSFINPAGKMLLGIEKAREGRKLIDIIRTPLVLDCIQETNRTGKSTEVEYERSAEKRWLRLKTHQLNEDETAANAKDSVALSGHVPVLLIVIDETRLKQLENLRRDFTANVSHELKTPLAAIKAYAETLLMGASEDPDACNRFIGRISEQAARLDTLIRDLLQLTRLQTQPDRPKLYPIKVGDLIQATIEDHRPLADKKDVSIQLNFEEGLQDSTVLSDLESLQIILNNLLGNAIRYNQHSGIISIQIRTELEHVQVEIKDTGIGIPRGDLDRIFERFYRVEKARSQDLGGTGLGLAIVKHLCQAIRAEILVASVLGEGSTFTVKLPKL